MPFSVALCLVFLRQGLLLILELVHLAGLVVYKPWLSPGLTFYRDGTAEIVHYSQVFTAVLETEPRLWALCWLNITFPITSSCPPTPPPVCMCGCVFKREGMDVGNTQVHVPVCKVRVEARGVGYSLWVLGTELRSYVPLASEPSLQRPPPALFLLTPTYRTHPKPRRIQKGESVLLMRLIFASRELCMPQIFIVHLRL